MDENEKINDNFEVKASLREEENHEVSEENHEVSEDNREVSEDNKNSKFKEFLNK